jgi:hypothetical protein
MFEAIKNHMNEMFDQTIADMAVNDQISLEEFQFKLKAIETARTNAMGMIDWLDPLSNNLL